MIQQRNPRVRRGATLALALGGVFFLLSTPLPAQYQVFAWESFETGLFPSSLARMHQATPLSVMLLDYASPGLPAELRAEPAPQECGRQGLKFQTRKGQEFLSVVNQMSLDRTRLGNTGRALYQADFFVPPTTADSPNVAILAMARTEGAGGVGSWKFYRFGLRGGSARKVFFAYSTGADEPALAFEESADALITKRPGWHRFQIIFEHQDKIYCCIDGKPTQFSPVRESTLKQLQAGIMVVSRENQEGIAYVDNLSIQWTPEDVPLPDSPWSQLPPTPVPSALSIQAAGPAPSAAGAGQPAQSGQPAAQPIPEGLIWHHSPDQAWQASQTAKRPLLILFTTPRSKGNQALEELLRTQATAREDLRGYVLLRVDVNQLSGGTLAQKYILYKFPCFVILRPDGTEADRMAFDNAASWQTIAPKLRAAARP